jgi:hypothetical protein
MRPVELHFNTSFLVNINFAFTDDNRCLRAKDSRPDGACRCAVLNVGGKKLKPAKKLLFA